MTDYEKRIHDEGDNLSLSAFAAIVLLSVGGIWFGVSCVAEYLQQFFDTEKVMALTLFIGGAVIAAVAGLKRLEGK